MDTRKIATDGDPIFNLFNKNVGLIMVNVDIEFTVNGIRHFLDFVPGLTGDGKYKATTSLQRPTQKFFMYQKFDTSNGNLIIKDQETMSSPEYFIGMYKNNIYYNLVEIGYGELGFASAGRLILGINEEGYAIKQGQEDFYMYINNPTDVITTYRVSAGYPISKALKTAIDPVTNRWKISEYTPEFYSFKGNKDCGGTSFKTHPTADLSRCKDLCDNDINCEYFSFGFENGLQCNLYDSPNCTVQVDNANSVLYEIEDQFRKDRNSEMFNLLQTQLNTATSELDTANINLTNKTSELDTAIVDLSELSTELTTVQAELTQKRNDLLNKQTSLQDQKLKLENAIAGLMSSNLNLSGAKENLANANQQLSDLNIDINTVKEDIDTANSQLIITDATISSAKTNIDTATEQLGIFDTILESLKDFIEYIV